MNCFYRFLTIMLLGGANVLLPGAEVQIVQAAGNLAIAIPDEAGHQTPLLEFFRRYERIIRQVGRLDNTSSSRPLQLELNSQITQAVWRKTATGQVLMLPTDYPNSLNDPTLGRMLTSAMIQSRLDNPPWAPLPEELLWIADGLWAEFVQREKSGNRILRFTWLPGLRNIAETGHDIILNSQLLHPPRKIRPGSAEWTLYTQRAQLMLEVARTLGVSNRNYPLKDYCFLIAAGKLPPRECFVRIFGTAARKRVMPGTWQSDRKFSEQQLGLKALSLLAMRSLFSSYVPMSAAGIRLRLEVLKQVKYTHSRGSFAMQASITDLPELVEKYDSCLNLPRIKLQSLNELAALAPLQLRSDIFTLASLTSDIGLRPAATVSRELKSSLQQLENKLTKLEQTEAMLIKLENSRMPLLYNNRHSLEGRTAEPELPPNIKQFLDETEKRNN